MSLLGIYDQDKDDQEFTITKDLLKKHNTLHIEVEDKDGQTQTVTIDLYRAKKFEMEFKNE